MIVVQPTGVLAVREIVVPLDLQITMFDNATPTDGTEFAITDVRLNSEPVTATPKPEDFAIAQFTDMSDADKVSAPSYEPFDAGVPVGAYPSRTVRTAPGWLRTRRDTSTTTSRCPGGRQIYQMPATVHAALAGGGMALAAPSPDHRAGKLRHVRAEPDDGGRMNYVVANTMDLTQRSDILASATTHYQAQVAMRSFLAANPRQQDATSGDTRTRGGGMSNGGDGTLGQHHFLSWSRQGLATLAQQPGLRGYAAGPGQHGGRAQRHREGRRAGVRQVPPVTVQTFGPGDVIGLDATHVVRTEPSDSTTNFEPNYLVGIEFDTPDFPWLFTPAAPAGDRIRPWTGADRAEADRVHVPWRACSKPLPAIDVTGLPPAAARRLVELGPRAGVGGRRARGHAGQPSEPSA